MTQTQVRPEPSGSSTIVSITDMPNTAPAQAGSVHELILDQLGLGRAAELPARYDVKQDG